MAYLGKTPSQAVRSRYYFTASGSETSLSPTQISGLNFSDAAYVDVSLNGVALVSGSDYTATPSTNTISGLTALTANDVIEIVVYDTFSVFGGNVKGDFNISNGTLSAEAVTVTGLTTTGNINFGDNDKAIFGAGSDLQIYHDGSHSYIKDAGTGQLRILATDLRINNTANDKSYITGTDGAELTLYHNGSGKLATTSSGIDVTGTALAHTVEIGDGSAGGTSEVVFSDNVSGRAKILYDHGASPNEEMGFEIAGTRYMTIENGGNIGIGTDAPAHNVEIVATNAGSVNDSLQIRNNATSTGTGSRIRFINSTDKNSDANGASIASVRDGNDNDLVFETENSEAMRIDHSGLVGIGESSPNLGSSGSGLHITGASNKDGTLKLDSSTANNSGVLQFTENGTDQWRIAYDASNNHLEFTESGVADRMVIADGGNVGIGTNSAFSPGSVDSLLSVAGNLTVIKNQATLTNIDVFNNSGDASARGQLRVGYDASNCLEIFRAGNSADIKYNTTQGGDLHFQISGSTKTRINGNGTIISENVGSTAANLEINGASTNGHYNILMNGNSNNGYKVAFKHGSSVVGTIITTNSSTAYNTSSDYRLKENVADMSGAIARVKQLSPKRFSWIVDDLDDANVDGFLAHEAQAVVPEAVTGSHNETEAIGDVTDADGNNVQTGVIQPAELEEGHSWTETGTQPVMQGIDQSKLVPLLTGALQEAITKIETLETQRADLEARLTALENA